MDLSGKGELFAVWGDIKFFVCVLLHFVEKNRFFILYLIGMGNRAEKCIVWAMCLKESH